MIRVSKRSRHQVDFRLTGKRMKEGGKEKRERRKDWDFSAVQSAIDLG